MFGTTSFLIWFSSNSHKRIFIYLKVHYIIGNTVQEILTFNGFKIMSDLMAPFDNLGNLSVYADTIKRNPKYFYTRPLHYYNTGSPADNPPESCQTLEFPSNDKSPNLLSAITNFSSTVDPFKFKILIHLLEDLHQPLHLTGKFRGGNDIKIEYKKNDTEHIYHTSLHALWDTGLFVNKFKQNTSLEIDDYFFQTSNYLYYLRVANLITFII